MYWCKKCGAVVSIGGKRDIVPCNKCGSDDYTASPQNLPKADAYSLLADVRADVKELLQMIEEIPCTCDKMFTDRGLNAPDCPRCNWIEDAIVKKVSEHFS